MFSANATRIAESEEADWKQVTLFLVGVAGNGTREGSSRDWNGLLARRAEEFEVRVDGFEHCGVGWADGSRVAVVALSRRGGGGRTGYRGDPADVFEYQEVIMNCSISRF